MSFVFAIGRSAAGSRSGGFSIGLPLLGGEGIDSVFGEAGLEPAGTAGAFDLRRGGGWFVGCAQADAGHDPEKATRALYRDLLAAARGFSLCRIWNYVPHINAAGPDGLENYRAFCRARSLAFEEEFGRDFKPRLPAASAVGSPDGRLYLLFAARRESPLYLENPRQVPAYDYPLEHGPRPPSFARATVVDHGGARDIFISGTSAIRGHATMAPGDTSGQLACTLENLREISRAAGLGDTLGAESAASRHVKVYLRRRSDYAGVARSLRGVFDHPGDRVMFLGAEICRERLNVEIEVTVLRARAKAKAKGP